MCEAKGGRDGGVAHTHDLLAHGLPVRMLQSKQDIWGQACHSRAEPGVSGHVYDTLRQTQKEQLQQTCFILFFNKNIKRTAKYISFLKLITPNKGRVQRRRQRDWGGRGYFRGKKKLFPPMLMYLRCVWLTYQSSINILIKINLFKFLQPKVPRLRRLRWVHFNSNSISSEFCSVLFWIHWLGHMTMTGPH